jgi:hypothetical protein
MFLRCGYRPVSNEGRTIFMCTCPSVCALMQDCGEGDSLAESFGEVTACD